MSSSDEGDNPERTSEADRVSALWGSLWRKHRVKFGVSAVTLLLIPVAVSIVSQVIGKGLDGIEFGEPVKARVMRLERERESGYDWLFAERRVLRPDELTAIGSAMAARGEEDKVRAMGGVDPLNILVALIIEGRRADGVTVTDIRINADCGTPLNGALIHLPKTGGGPQTNVRLVFDLDQPGKKALAVNPDRSTGSEYFLDNSIPLAENEQTVIMVSVRTRQQSCTFTFDVGASDGTTTDWVRVDTGGRNLAVSGLAGGVADAEQLIDFTGYGVLYLYNGKTVKPVDATEMRDAS